MLPKIFEKVRILDFSRLLPGPFASRLLEEMGAKVTCVLPPLGDPILGDYTPFAALRENKKFLRLDLKDPANHRKVREQVAASEILLEGFRPGTMARLALSFEEAVQLRPDILYVSLVGYPKEDEKYRQGGHDLNFLVDSGIYSLLYPDASQEIPALQLGDVLGGLDAVLQILAAWIHRLQNPAPQHLEVSIVAGLERLWEYLRHDTTPGLLPALTGSLARYRIYLTKDRRRVAVASLEPKFYEALLAALSLTPQPGEGEAELVDRIQEVFQTKTWEEWGKIFQDQDACVSLIPNRSEMLGRR
ncbi:MAG TPA: hypothetical protein DF383_11295 [Deltaproteobacteria bacterium]|nr:hypothetical protein [Deltaproteobacteria bacterium]